MAIYRSGTEQCCMFLGVLGCVLLVFAFCLLYEDGYGNNLPRFSSTTVQESTSVSHADLTHTFETISKVRRPDIVVAPPGPHELPYTSLYNVVEHWNPDDPDPPADFKEVLQHFDFGNPHERSLAEKYRNAEIPFKIYNVSDFMDVSKLWSDDYLAENLDKMKSKYHVERSKDNHFMFWSGRGRGGKGYKPPTEIVNGMTFSSWLQLAKEADAKKLKNDTTHYYFIAGADANENGRTFISRDLKLLSTRTDNFFITKVSANKGIQCRFGMRGIIAESHYDSGKNMVVLLRGKKRYILNPPRACPKLAIIAEKKHPSFRHSVIDWSDIKQAKSHDFEQVEAIDTIVHAGEILYIPSFWFHYVISLDYSIQCNSRSGFPESMFGRNEIDNCFSKSLRQK